MASLDIPQMFPPDGEWTKGPSWNSYLALCLDPAEARRGLERLGAVFPPGKLQELLEPQNGIPCHPLVQDYLFKGSRFQLVHLAVAIERFKPCQLRDRLRNRFEYVGFCAEMLAGLTLASTGASLVHE